MVLKQVGTKLLVLQQGSKLTPNCVSKFLIFTYCSIKVILDSLKNAFSDEISSGINVFFGVYIMKCQHLEGLHN